jgi:hypothetical protein
MPQVEDALRNTNQEPGPGRQLQEYFAGIAGTPQKRENAPVTVVAVNSDGAVQKAANSAGSDTDELARLRQLLHEKDHAVFRAVVSANELRSELEATKAETETLRTELTEIQRSAVEPEKNPALNRQVQEEVARQRREWLRIQKQLEQEHANRKAELVQVRGQWFATQQQLEQESRARRMEKAQASAKIASLERNLENANSTITEFRNKPAKSIARRRMVAVFASAALILGGGAIWTQFSSHVSAAASPAITVINQSAPQASNRKTQSTIFPVSQKGFQGSLGRLNNALSSFASRPPEEVLLEARKRSGDPTLCAFRWNNGQPAVVFNGGSKESLASSLNRCAAAIERLP